MGADSRDIWRNMLLQLIGIAILGGLAMRNRERQATRSIALLSYLGLAFLVVAALQQVPLPPSIWMSGFRTRIASDYALLGLDVPPLPISLTPYESFCATLYVIPAFAMFLVIVERQQSRQSWLAWALLGGAVARIVLLVVQFSADLEGQRNLAGGFSPDSHGATLLLASLPFVAALAASGKRRNNRRPSKEWFVFAPFGLILIVGICLAGTIAVQLLAIPVLFLSALIILAPTSRLRSYAAAIGGLSLVVAMTFLSVTPVSIGKSGRDSGRAAQSRALILETTERAVAGNLPLGSGLGSFGRVYPLYEQPDHISAARIRHASNDYIELALEMGLPGIGLALCFLLWWGRATWICWRNHKSTSFERAATIASGAILTQSMVDSSLRSSAIGACLALCAGLMADRQPNAGQKADLRPTRHFVIE